MGKSAYGRPHFYPRRAPGTVNTRTGGDRDIRDKAGSASLAYRLANVYLAGHKAFQCPVPSTQCQIFKRPACVMVAPGDADALNLRHIRRHRGYPSSRGCHVHRGGT